MLKANTFQFLEQLAVNNNREWFQVHKADHDLAREDVLEFISNIINALSKVDSTISPDLNTKDCVMRIYRDVRFSKDKTPYKTNFGAGISQNGKNFKGPGYYLHIHPEQSFLAGGCWFPEADHRKAIRQEIDYNSSDFHSILEDKSFKKVFGNLDTEGALKTAPKGYPSDHPNIEYLKLKSFTVSHQISKEQLLTNDAVQIIVEGFKVMNPFISFLRNAIV